MNHSTFPKTRASDSSLANAGTRVLVDENHMQETILKKESQLPEIESPLPGGYSVRFSFSKQDSFTQTLVI